MISIRFTWFDLWVGAYWDRKARALYICPVPCVAIRLERDFRKDSARRWFGLLGLVNRYVLGPLSGKVLGYRVDDTGKPDGWLWMRRP